MKNRPDQKREREQWRLDTILEIKEELRNNPIFHEILQRTEPEYHDSFIDEYAQDKM